MTTDMVILALAMLVYVPLLVSITVGAARRAYLRAGCDWHIWTHKLKDGSVFRNVSPAYPAKPTGKTDEEQ